MLVCAQHGLFLVAIWTEVLGGAISPVGTMSDPRSNVDLWRTSLCFHGAEHGQSRPDCRFAHSLSELRPPDERFFSYEDQWRNVDRFYGQFMDDDQLERIRKYYVTTPPCERPLWSVGLYLIAIGAECRLGFALPWDFGLVRDYDDLLDRRRYRSCPFRQWPGLWYRLSLRRQTLLSYESPPHQLGLVSPSSRDASQDRDGEEGNPSEVSSMDAAVGDPAEVSTIAPADAVDEAVSVFGDGSTAGRSSIDREDGPGPAVVDDGTYHFVPNLEVPNLGGSRRSAAEQWLSGF